MRCYDYFDKQNAIEVGLYTKWKLTIRGHIYGITQSHLQKNSKWSLRAEYIVSQFMIYVNEPYNANFKHEYFFGWMKKSTAEELLMIYPQTSRISHSLR